MEAIQPLPRDDGGLLYRLIGVAVLAHRRQRHATRGGQMALEQAAEGGPIARTRKPNPAKNITYECGVATVGDPWVQFKVQYYIFALVFLVFEMAVLRQYRPAVPAT